MTPGECENGRTILLAEDQECIRKFLVTLLKTSGFTVLTAGDGLEALHTAREHKGKIDLLLADVQMPQMTGIELATQISLERSDTKVLLMSGVTSGMLVLDRGWQFIPKPFLPDMLKQKIELVLQDEMQMNVPELGEPGH